MRKAVLIVAMSALPLSMAVADSYTIDPQHTFPNFSISHLGFSTMHGRFDETSGKLDFDPAKKTGSVDISIHQAYCIVITITEITINAKSVNTGYEKRDNHLRSPDFLNTAEHPTITFKSTKASFASSTGKVEGMLTMAGATKPVTLNVTSFKCGVHPMSKKNVCGFDAETTIKRSEFGVNYGIPGIGDDMKLVFEVEAVKK